MTAHLGLIQAPVWGVHIQYAYAPWADKIMMIEDIMIKCFFIDIFRFRVIKTGLLLGGGPLYKITDAAPVFFRHIHELNPYFILVTVRPFANPRDF